MPPTRTTISSRTVTAGSSLLHPKGILTRSRQASENVITATKRKAVVSPPKHKAVKRSAFGDLTNAAGKSVIETKKVLKSFTSTSITKPIAKVEKKEVKKVTTAQNRVAPHDRNKKIVLKSRNVSTVKKTVSKPVALPPAVEKAETVAAAPTRRSGRVTRRSLMSSSDENSLYVSALDESGDSILCVAEITKKSSETLTSEVEKGSESVTREITQKVSETVISSPEVPAAKPKENRVSRPVIPAGIEDFDGLHWEDPNQVGNYAHDIFEYLKRREAAFVVRDYMDSQIHLNKWMRSLLVDWLVEVQENFELNHETLYLGVKLVDLYLSKVVVRKENLQLVGAASIFIASKFDERIPPLVEDLIYMCNGAYTHQQLLKMEVSILKAIDYELGVPLSYRFQRRYARCAHIAMPQLTLARYILELSLMEYSFVTYSDSKMGAAALLLALKMQKISSWTPTLEFYSGYKLSDIKDIVIQLNDMLHKKPKDTLMTVRNKYAHEVFFEVATLPLLSNEDLFKTDV